MQFAPKYREDISKYFKGTYVKLKEFGDQLFLIRSVDSLSVRGTHEEGEFIIYLNDETPYEVDYILPHKSFFQYGSHAVQLRRVPDRQYFRGLCVSNTRLEYLRDGRLHQHDLGFPILKAFVTKPAFPNLRAAIGANESTIAISPRMMYHRLQRQIYVDFVPVAKVSPSKLEVAVTKPIFKDEILDFLKSTNEVDIFKLVDYVPPPPKEKTKPEDLLKELAKTAKKEANHVDW
jgi:hypothetical protein